MAVLIAVISSTIKKVIAGQEIICFQYIQLCGDSCASHCCTSQVSTTDVGTLWLEQHTQMT